MKLIFFKKIGIGHLGLYDYDFYFSENSDKAWNETWAEDTPTAFSEEELEPDKHYVDKIIRLRTVIPFKSIQNTPCFSYESAIDGITALVWEDISEYPDYPEPIRLVFYYGETLTSIADKLARRHTFFNEDI